MGESMYVHVFGAYFGLSVARVLYNEHVHGSRKEGPVYHSDIFSMIGKSSQAVTDRHTHTLHINAPFCNKTKVKVNDDRVRLPTNAATLQAGGGHFLFPHSWVQRSTSSATDPGLLFCE